VILFIPIISRASVLNNKLESRSICWKISYLTYIMATAKKFPRPPKTAREVFEMLPEGTLAEVMDNELHVFPSPSFEHQVVVGDLLTGIVLHIRDTGLGKSVSRPIDVYLDDNNIVEPDILFISTANLGIIQKGKIKGTPDIFVEVLSSNRKHDLERKKNLYEKFGVKEYFIVDPETKETITYYHDGKKYIQQESKKGKIKSKLLKKTFSF